MKLSDLAGARNVTGREMREIWKGLRRGRSSSLKLSDIAGNKTLSKEDWQKAQAVIRESQTETRRRLKKNYFGVARGIGHFKAEDEMKSHD
jgi:hypothetical protein